MRNTQTDDASINRLGKTVNHALFQWQSEGNRKWRLACSTENAPPVTLEVPRGIFRERKFPSNNPERVKTIAERFAGGNTS